MNSSEPLPKFNPQPPIKRHRFISKIVEINDLTPTVREFILSVPSEFTFYAGQFITLRFKMNIDGKEKTIGRAYSMASAPHKLSNNHTLELCIKLVEEGITTPVLFANPPTEINVVGPMGKFFLTPEHKKKELVFIATGTGIAPFKSMIEALLLDKHSHPITLLTGVRHDKEVLYPELWQSYQTQHPQLKYENIVSRPESPEYAKAGKPVGRVTDLLPKYIHKDSPKELQKEQLFIICGLTPMIDSVQEILLAHNVKEKNILFEKYD